MPARLALKSCPVGGNSGESSGVGAYTEHSHAADSVTVVEEQRSRGRVRVRVMYARNAVSLTSCIRRCF